MMCKTWRTAHGLAVSGYALTLMAIAYLQRRGVLPVLQRGEADECVVEGWDCRFVQVGEAGGPKVANGLEIGWLMQGFFEWYGYAWEFATMAVVVSSSAPPQHMHPDLKVCLAGWRLSCVLHGSHA